MNILKFEQPEEKEVPEVLSHISISVDGTEYSIKEEVGLKENNKQFGSKELLLAYLQETL